MKILVVDDEKDMQTLFEQRFRKEIRDHSIELVFAEFIVQLPIGHSYNFNVDNN